jgi:predicted RNase H-like HicB family nuclease
MKKFLVIFEPTVSGYSVHVPDLPGCISTGDTKEQAERNIYEAIKFHIEGMIADGAEIPEGKTESEYLVLAE